MSDSLIGMSPEAIRNGTGRDWDEWIRLLDEAGGASMTHTELAKYVLDNYDLSVWWGQGVAIGYHTAKGLRPKGMTSKGFAANASKTLSIPLNRLWKLWADDDLRAQWLDPDLLTVSSASENRTFNAKYNPDGTRISINFSAVGDDRSKFGLQHAGLANAEEIEERKAFWKAAIERLVEVAGKAS